MNLNIPLLKPIRILLFPFSLLYGLVICVRNWCYDRKIFPSTSFNLPVICIGNLAVGGTGKSPLVEFLVSKLKNKFEVSILSRGYKRKTKGYALADQTSTALDIGDEPMLFHTKFPDVAVAVGEERMFAIPQLLHDRPNTAAIILDDAFQHRSVISGMNILLTDYNNLFTRDWFLPTGDLRDEKISYRRCQLIVVTKCKIDLTDFEKEQIIQEIKPYSDQKIFFSFIEYGFPYHITRKMLFQITTEMDVLLVTGIANPEPLKKWLDANCNTFYELTYSDHHIFSIDDLKNIIRQFHHIDAKNKIILTTEKDAVRLTKFSRELQELPFYVIPIQSSFLFNGEKPFTDIIVKFISEFKFQS